MLFRKKNAVYDLVYKNTKTSQKVQVRISETANTTEVHLAITPTLIGKLGNVLIISIGLLSLFKSIFWGAVLISISLAILFLKRYNSERELVYVVSQLKSLFADSTK